MRKLVESQEKERQTLDEKAFSFVAPVVAPRKLANELLIGQPAHERLESSAAVLAAADELAYEHPFVGMCDRLGEI